MAKREHFMVIDIGSTAVHMAEFESMPDNSLILHAFDNLEYNENVTDENRNDVLAGTIRRSLASGKYKSRVANICISGQSAFMRFVKLPPVTDDESSVKKIVEFEAKQNVPFPIDEVVWDYQLIGNEEDDDELEVMFAVIKTDVVQAVMQAVKSAGVKPRIVDFSPAALYNAARANYIGEDECCMLLDIGGKCTTLLFLEGGRLFARSIPIAGASISQQIAKEFNVPVSEAEMLKRRYGFVALGGAYEEPESEVAATISKIIRNVMTRLHGEINRTINIYRSQQKGSKPVKLFLAGGSSTMAFTEHFFSEKLRMEVSYFNVFNIVTVPEHVDRESLSQQAHLFPGVVGTALRNVHHCPVEISLSTENQGSAAMRKKLPLILLGCAIFTFACAVPVLTNMVKSRDLDKALVSITESTKVRSSLKNSISRALASETMAKEAYSQAKELLSRREPWTELFNAIQVAKPMDVWVASIEQTKAASAEDMKAAKEEADTGMMDFFGGPPAANAEKKAAATTDASAEWFLIKGYSVSIPDQEFKNKGAMGEPTGNWTRRIFTKEQTTRFDQIRKKLLSENEAEFQANPEMEERLKRLGELIPFQDDEKNRVQRENQGLETYFLNALRLNGMFDPVQTTLSNLNDEVTPNAKNLTSFAIRLRLKKPIDLKR